MIAVTRLSGVRRGLSFAVALAALGCGTPSSAPPSSGMAGKTGNMNGDTTGDATGGNGVEGTGGAGTGGSMNGGTGGAPSGGSGGNGVDASADQGTFPATDAGIGGPSRCTAGKYLICEDFEATAEGAIPTGWTKHGNAAVAADEAARGTHSLKIAAANNGERRIYADAAKLGGGHWGRIYFKVKVPVPNVFVHSTIIAFRGIGPTRGSEEVRVVDTVKNANGKYQFIYNVQPNGAEFGTGSPYNYSFDDKWHCAEWHIDAPTQSYHFFYDGVEVTSIAKNNGPMRYAGTDIPPVFSELHVGWNNYQSASPGFVAWIDEVALDTNRIGCDN